MDSKKIGNFISERRKILGLTQQQLAEKLDVSNKAISKWETGEGFPDITIIPELCKQLNISADDFFEGEKKSNGSACDYCENKRLAVSTSMESKSQDIFKMIRFYYGDTIKTLEVLIPYVFYIVIAYYLISFSFYSSFPGEVVCIWLFLGIPIFNVIMGIIYTLKKKLFFSRFICIMNGIAIVPVIYEFGGEPLLTLVIFAGYVFSSYIGVKLVLLIKNKYNITIIRKEQA